MLQVELMRGEEMTPPEIVQLIAWSKEYAAPFAACSCACVLTTAGRYNRDMDRQFGFKPDRPLLVFFDDLLKVSVVFVIVAAAVTTTTTSKSYHTLTPPRSTNTKRARS